jgi:hypothetical protein
VILTPGQAHDLTGAQMLLDDVDPHALIGDKAYHYFGRFSLCSNPVPRLFRQCGHR